MIRLVINRGLVVPFAQLPPNFAALDGYTPGPALDPAHRRFSFDHHQGCIRMVTHSTCQQVLDAILLGLEVDGLDIGINDVDEDTMLATWLLLHPEQAEFDHVQQAILVMGLLDAHGPAYPLTAPRQRIQQQALGVFSPLHKAMRDKSYATISLRDMTEQLLERIDRWLIKGENFEGQIDPQPEWQVYYIDEQMVVIEADSTAMDIVYRHRPRGICFSRQLDGSIAYTIGRRSDLVPDFDVAFILARLAQVEPGWGGGSSIGGAPRHADGSRSRLDPDHVVKIVVAARDES